MRVAVIVPWRDKGDPRRRMNLFATVEHLNAAGYTPTVTGDNRAGPFNRSAAYNEGRRTTPADVYVWHEADMIVPADQLDEGIRLAAATTGLVIPFTTYHILNPEHSDLVHAGADPADQDCNTIGGGQSIGAVGITSEATMQMVGRWDETFSGWGYDDNAMHRAFTVCAGPTRWVDGPGYHLWHPTGAAPADQAEALATARNTARLQHYLAEDRPDGIRALTAEKTPTPQPLRPWVAT